MTISLDYCSLDNYSPTIPTCDYCSLDNYPRDNSHLGQLPQRKFPPRITAVRQLTNNCRPGQMPQTTSKQIQPKIIAPRTGTPRQNLPTINTPWTTIHQIIWYCSNDQSIPTGLTRICVYTTLTFDERWAHLLYAYMFGWILKKYSIDIKVRIS